MDKINWLLKIDKDLVVALIGFKSGLLKKKEMIKFSEMLLENSYYEKDLEIIAGAELYESEDLNKIIYDKIKTLDEKKINIETKKIELSELLEIKDKDLKDFQLQEKLEEIYVKYNYPEELKSFSKYSDDLFSPKESLNQAIKFLMTYLNIKDF